MSDTDNIKKIHGIPVIEIEKKACPGETWEMTAYRLNESDLKAKQDKKGGTASQLLGEKQFELPLWPEEDRAAPSAIVRSSLFGLVKRGTRRTMTRELIATWKGDEIRYTGQQLDQSDFDVWMQLAHLAARQGIEDKAIAYTTHKLLKDMGRTTGKNDYEWLKKSIARLSATNVEITRNGKKTIFGSLVVDGNRDEETGELQIRMSLQLSALFDLSYTRVLLENRLKLKTQLAKWLHCYVASHAVGKPHRFGMDRLRKLAGSTGNIREFRKLLRRDMETLQECGIVESWRITEGDSLEFIRPNRKHIKEI